MKLLAIVLCLVLTTNCKDLNGECKGDRSAPVLVIEVPYPDAKSANLLHLQAGSCDETSFEQFGGTLVFNEVDSIVELTIPIFECEIRGPQDFGLYHAKANVTLGASLNGLDIVFRNVYVVAECGDQTTYEVGFEYQNINPHEQNQNCQKIDGNCVYPSFENNTVLEIKEYTDKNFTAEVTPENRAKIAGEIIYLSLRATSINQNHKFAVTQCSIVIPDGTRINLIAPGADTSPTCSMNSIGLAAWYDGDHFNFQHILFHFLETFILNDPTVF